MKSHQASHVKHNCHKTKLLNNFMSEHNLTYFRTQAYSVSIQKINRGTYKSEHYIS